MKLRTFSAWLAFSIVLSSIACTPERTHAQETEPCHIHLSWQGDPSTTITVVWQTPADAGTYVEYGITPSYGNSVSGSSWSGGSGVLHVVEITGLVPNTTYHYRCGSTSAWSTDRTFTTGLEKGNESCFKFAAWGDSRSDSERRKEVSAAVLASNPRFSLFTGDLVDDGSVQSYWDSWFTDMEPTIANTSFMPSIGNHENNAWNYYEQFVLPNNEQWYSFDYGNAHFICLSTETAYTFGSAQHTWLESDLKSTEAKWKFVFFHRPPYSSGSHGNDSTIISALCPLFEMYHVDMVLLGHDHDYERTYSLRNSAVVNDSIGTTYVVTGGAGAPLYPVGSSYFTAKSDSVYHFCEIIVNGDVLTYSAKLRDGSAFDNLTIDKRTLKPVNWTIADSKINITYNSAYGTLTLPASEVKLHWGINNWTQPPSDLWPAGSVGWFDGKAAQTPMVNVGGANWSIEVPLDLRVNMLDFAFTDGANWDNNFTKDWHVPIITPAIISNYEVFIDNDSAIFNVTTDIPTVARIEYGLDATYGFGYANLTSATLHNLSLEGLSAGTTYHYRIVVESACGLENYTADLTFATLPNAIPEAHVIMLVLIAAATFALASASRRSYRKQ